MSAISTRSVCTCGRPRERRYGRGPDKFHTSCDRCRRPGRSKQQFTKYRQRLKYEALMAYTCGDVPRCACKKCPEHLNPHIEFLTIDHVNGKGAKHRITESVRGWTVYRWLKQHGYPPGFQVLCLLCNFVKRDKTVWKCPHESD